MNWPARKVGTPTGSGREPPPPPDVPPPAETVTGGSGPEPGSGGGGVAHRAPILDRMGGLTGWFGNRPRLAVPDPWMPR